MVRKFKFQFGTTCFQGDTGVDCHAIKLLYQQMHTLCFYSYTDSMTLFVLLKGRETVTETEPLTPTPSTFAGSCPHSFPFKHSLSVLLHWRVIDCIYVYFLVRVCALDFLFRDDDMHFLSELSRVTQSLC